MQPQRAGLQTSAVRRDIDQAAKYVGAGAATVGVAGSGLLLLPLLLSLRTSHLPLLLLLYFSLFLHPRLHSLISTPNMYLTKSIYYNLIVPTSDGALTC